MPLDSIIYSGVKDGQRFEIRTSERRNTWTPPDYISAEMLHKTNVCGTRASFIFIVKGDDENERFMLIKEKHIDPEKDAEKYKGLKTVGGRAKRHGIDVSIEDALFREAGDEGGFRLRNAYESFIYEIDGSSVVPMGVKFAETIGAVVFFLAELKNYPPEKAIDDFKGLLREGKGDYISEFRYFTMPEFNKAQAEHILDMRDGLPIKTIMENNDRTFIRRETKEILLDYHRLTRPKRLRFTKEDLDFRQPSESIWKRIGKAFRRSYRPIHTPSHGDLRIPDRLRSNMLAKAGLEETLHNNSMNSCKAFLAYDYSDNSLHEAKLIVQTDLFFYELFINVSYPDSIAQPSRASMEHEVEWFAKRYVIDNFKAILYYDMLNSYMVKPAETRESLIDMLASDKGKITRHQD